MDKIIKKSKPAVIAVIAVFILLHTLLISTFFMSDILAIFGIKVFPIFTYLVTVIPYVFFTFLQIVVWAMNVEKYHLPKVVAIIIMAGLKAYIMIGLELGISTEPSKIFTPIYRVTLAYYILCGLLCFAEVVTPLFVYIKNHIVPKFKTKTVLKVKLKAAEISAAFFSFRIVNQLSFMHQTSSRSYNKFRKPRTLRQYTNRQTFQIILTLRL